MVVVICFAASRAVCPHRPRFLRPFIKEDAHHENYSESTGKGPNLATLSVLLSISTCALVMRIAAATFFFVNMDALIAVIVWVMFSMRRVRA